MISIKRHLANLPFAFAGVMLFVMLVIPALTQRAGAAQITSRKVTLSSSSPRSSNATTTYSFSMTLPTTGTVVKSIGAQACDAAVGTCNAPAGFSISSSTISAQPSAGCGDTSGWTVSTATSGQLRMSKAGAAATPSGTCTFAFGNVQNPTGSNTAFFLRVTTYSDASWTTVIDTGTVASATTVDSGSPGNGLQVSAAVAEVLNFCVGATSVDDAGTTSPGADCTAISGTVVNLGTLDTTHVNVTPVSTNCSATGCSKNGIAMVRSNAVNGTAVFYDAIQQSSGTNHVGDLRIAGATCNAAANNSSTDVTDQCFNNTTTQTAITAGTEKWGLTVAGVNCKSSASYASCTGTSDSHLARDTNYDGVGSSTYTAEADQSVTTTTSNGFAWDESGTSTILATSASAGTKQVDDEALILKFAATPSITTPFGSYAGYADFVCVPTY